MDRGEGVDFGIRLAGIAPAERDQRQAGAARQQARPLRLLGALDHGLQQLAGDHERHLALQRPRPSLQDEKRLRPPSSVAAPSSLVFPIPAGPSISSIDPWPSARRSRASRTTFSSASRSSKGAPVVSPTVDFIC